MVFFASSVGRKADTAVILAGGRGTRLGALASALPKPMLPVAGRPFLEYLVRQVARDGFRNIVLATGYRAEAVAAHFGDGRKLGVQIRYSSESTPLGTGGAIRLAAELVPGRPLLVLNGDSFFDVDLRGVLEALASDVVLTIALARVPDGGRFGAVDQAADGSITRFVQRPTEPRGRTINAGIYGFSAEAVEAIPPGVVSLEQSVLPALVGRRMRGVVLPGYFVDIGVPDAYAELAGRPHPVLAALGLDAIG